MENPRVQGEQTYTGFGAIVLAAYEPEESLFRTQLESIAQQTHMDFVCLITADGGYDQVEELVRQIVPGDERFKVLGFRERLGFYGNFERGLTFVPPGANWVALSDQDDYWYPEKLATLLPHLEENIVVSGQARVVTDGGEVIDECTDRRNSPFLQLLIQNQFTGGLMVFRRTLLDKALPFPRLETMTQVHDHWLAVCAACIGHVKVIDVLVQDYIQHGNNVIGEAITGFNPVRSYRRAQRLALKFEGSRNPLAIIRLTNSMTFGWRRVMAEALANRFPDSNKFAIQADMMFGSGHAWWELVSVFAAGLRARTVSVPFFLTFASGALLEVLRPAPGPLKGTRKDTETISLG